MTAVGIASKHISVDHTLNHLFFRTSEAAVPEPCEWVVQQIPLAPAATQRAGVLMRVRHGCLHVHLEFFARKIG